jgi:hypothetical protein
MALTSAICSLDRIINKMIKQLEQIPRCAFVNCVLYEVKSTIGSYP